jgi:hypothetical protein
VYYPFLYIGRELPLSAKRNVTSSDINNTDSRSKVVSVT